MTIARALFDLVVAGIATSGFGLIFRTEPRSLPAGAIIGGIGYVIYDTIVLEFGSTAIAAFLAGLLVGIISEVVARILKKPAIIYATMGVIPLVPGYGLYQTMELMVQANYVTALSVGMETLLVAGAIAMSLGFSSVITRRVLRKFISKLPCN